jgi:beta-glucosidase/6-phospho-beta-glucosidase/beta-galactosidase
MAFPFLTGIEGTQIFGSGYDMLDLSHHRDLFATDLHNIQVCGVRELRYPIPWHKIERTPRTYDWSWLDVVMATMHRLGLEPIADPLHHTSYPEWLEGGPADERLGDAYERFVTAFAQRYPWVTRYTVVNEPWFTTLACTHMGLWHPGRTGEACFAPALLNVAKTIVRVTNTLERLVPGVRFLHADTCEEHRPLDDEAAPLVEMRNQRRFLVTDLILGRVDRHHPLYGALAAHGDEDGIKWFADHRARIDVLGLDYYMHSEMEWTGDQRMQLHSPRGFAAVAEVYRQRYGVPVMLSETNIRGEIADRITWLKFMVEQAEELERRAAGSAAPFVGFCWYPFVDSCDWDSLACRADDHNDPQGIMWTRGDVPWWHAERKPRNHSELSMYYAQLTRHHVSATDLPAYEFSARVAPEMRPFLPLMDPWRWQPPPEHRKLAA